MKIAPCNDHYVHVLYVSGYSRDERSTTIEAKTSLTALVEVHYPQMLSAPFCANPDSCKLFSKKLCRPREDEQGDFPGRRFTKRNVGGKSPFLSI